MENYKPLSKGSSSKSNFLSKNNKRILFISGRKGVGKTTLANMLIDLGYDCCILNLSGLLKECMLPLINTFVPEVKSIDMLENDAIKKKKILGLGNNLTIRKILQLFGTEFGKYQIDKNIWIKAMHKKLFGTTDVSATNDLKLIISHKYVIIHDARFINQIEYGKKIGAYTLKLSIPGSSTLDNHPSEKEMDEYKEYDKVFVNTKPIKKLQEFAKVLAKDILRWSF